MAELIPLLELNAPGVLHTGLVAVVLASAFAVGGSFRPSKAIGLSDRTLVSFGAGMSVAYVFVHVLGELAEARAVVADLESVPRPFEGRIVYFVGLLGFLAAYGLDHLYEPGEPDPRTERNSLTRQVGGFALYAVLVAYLLVNGIEQAPNRLTLFAVAMAAHFLSINRTLSDEYGAAYTWPFRAVLSAAVLIGWAVGLTAVVPRSAIAMLMAFVSGAVIMNSAVSELPAEREGRLGAFVTGGLVFGLILLALA